jgi:hypothetical protein
MADSPRANSSVADESNAVEVISVPDKRVGLIIGSNGSRISEIKAQSGAAIHVEPTGPPMRKITIWGRPAAVQTAVALVNATLSTSEAPTQIKGQVTKPGEEHATVEVAQQQVGIVIGKGGCNIRDLQAHSVTTMWVDTTDEGVVTPGTRIVHIVGPPPSVELARQLMSGLLDGSSSGRPATVADVRQRVSGHAAAASPAQPAPTTTPWMLPTPEPAVHAEGPYETEDVRISDGGLATLLDPSTPAALAQLQASGLMVHFARTRDDASRPAKRARHETDDAAAAEHTAERADGTRAVRLTGNAAALASAKALLAALEAQAAAAKALHDQRSLSSDEAVFQYYTSFYQRAGLPYAPPTRLWQDEVDAEANRYKMWAVGAPDARSNARRRSPRSRAQARCTPALLC